MRPGPDHYTSLKPEPIDVIRAWDLPWCTANALKYIARYRKKGGVEDLKKARHYLEMEIQEIEGTDGRCGGGIKYDTEPAFRRCLLSRGHDGVCLFPVSERSEPIPPQDGE